MGRGTILPMGADIQTFIGKTVLQDVPASLLVKFVCVAHTDPS